jgi:hypothetical protein
MTVHQGTFVKVNAPVDIGIAPLVAALSEIEGLETVESCQGDPGGKKAFVLFRFGDWDACGRLLFDHILPAMSDDLRAVVSLTIQAYDETNALASISLDASAIEEMTAVVRRLSLTVSAGIAMARDAHGLAVAQGIASPSRL